MIYYYIDRYTMFDLFVVNCLCKEPVNSTVKDGYADRL